MTSTNPRQSPAFKVLESPERTDMWMVSISTIYIATKARTCALSLFLLHFSLCSLSDSPVNPVAFNIWMQKLLVNVLPTALFVSLSNDVTRSYKADCLKHTRIDNAYHMYLRKKFRAQWQKVCAEKRIAFYLQLSKWAPLSWRHQVSYYLAKQTPLLRILVGRIFSENPN